ncbi:MAG: 4a-hydroxytetrahydrobiopterin dehydratase [Candidatus Rokubacteria bacterium]|nr:4a-hydroxytetrahydrobiopterin dehydratase [Candidatus Rokubacteria bacterium]
MPGGPRLPEDVLARELATLPEWTRDADAIQRTWRFADFKTAMIFANGVAALAEKANHHPNITVHDYNQVTLRLWSHDAGGLSARDVDLARTINATL